MLSATAYTLRQKARLAVTLATVGGFVDAVGFITLAGIFTSNMTGNTAALAARFAESNWSAAFQFLFVIGAFFSGTVISSLIAAGGLRLGIKSVYAIALSLELVLLSVFLLAASWATSHRIQLGYGMIWMPAMAMGLQIATITQIAGAVVRTTHVTGVLTDLGIESIQLLFWLRDNTSGKLLERLRSAFSLSTKHTSFQRLILLASIWCSFTLGAGVGVWSLHHFGLHCLAGPILFLMFVIGLDMLHPIADMQEVDHARHDQELKRFGIDPGLLPATVRVFRIKARGRRRRKAPDLGRLPEKVGADIRALILMFEEGLHLDENNMVGLRSAVGILRERGCELVVCVTESRLFVQIQEGPAGGALGGANLCPDPEFAVARAIELAQPFSRQNVA
jgi:uncharacterized membrane protein YoaK (UPF0700 family)